MLDALSSTSAPTPVVDQWPDAPAFISLLREAGSPAAQALSATVAAEIAPLLQRDRPLGRLGEQTHRAAVAAILAGLLKAGLRGQAVRAQRGKSKAARQWQRLPSGGKAPLGYDAFWKRIDALQVAGLVEEGKGISFQSAGVWAGSATRLRCTPSLLARAADLGATAGTFAADWPLSITGQRLPPVIWGDAVRCMAVPPREGNAKRAGFFPADQDSQVSAAIAHLERLNHHLAGFNVTGCVPPVLVRKFFSDIRLGGRLYAVGSDPYQTMRGEDRRRLLRIDGEPVAEIDLRASQLSILLALTGQDVPADPYTTGELATFDRSAVKAFFTQALNSGHLPKKWSPQFPDAVRALPIGRLAAAAEAVFPILADAASILPADLTATVMALRGSLGWGVGQFLVAIEAEIMADALSTLMDQGIPALPIHDGLLCRQRDCEETRRSLVEAFQRQVGATQRSTRRRPVAGSEGLPRAHEGNTMSDDHIARVRDALEAAGIEVDEVRPLPTGLGQQLRCAGGQVVVVYNSGKVVPQGKDAGMVKALLEGVQGPVKKPAAPKAPVRTTSPSLDLPEPAAASVRPMVVAAAAGGDQSGRVFWTDLPWDGREMPWDPMA